MKPILMALAASMTLPGLISGQTIKEEIEAAQRVVKTYCDLRAQAISENKPLIVWLGYVCPPCEAELEGCLHYHTGNFFGETNPCIIVAMPRGGNLWTLAPMPTNSSMTQVREQMRKTWKAAAPPDPWKAYFREIDLQGMFPSANAGTMRGGSC